MAPTPNLLQQSMMQNALATQALRRTYMEKAYDAYMGIKPRSHESSRLLVTEPGAIDDNVPVNIIKPIVQAQADYLFGDPGFPTVELPTSVDGEDTDVDSQPEKWLKECFRLNNVKSLFLESGINGCLFGTPYIKIVTDNAFKNTSGTGKDYPRLVSLDPYNMTLVWAPMDTSDISQYIWSAQQGNLHEPYYPFPVNTFQYTERTGAGTWQIRNTWAPVGTNQNEQSQGDTITWPYDWPPVLHWKNLPTPNQAYGDPDVDENLIQMQAALAYSLSKRQRVDRKNAHPKVHTSGMTAKLDPADEVWESDEDAKIELLSPKWDSTAAKQTGDDIYEYILELTSTPSIMLGRTDQMRITSGVAQLVRMAPALRKTGTRRLMAEPAIVELCRRLLELGGFGPDCVVNVTWPELIPVDPLTRRQIAMIDYNLGVKSEVLNLKNGYKLSDLDPNGPPKQQAPPAAPGAGNTPGSPDTNNTNPDTAAANTKKAVKGDTSA